MKRNYRRLLGILALCFMLCTAFVPQASAAKAVKEASKKTAEPTVVETVKEKPNPKPLKIDAEGIEFQDHKSYPIAEVTARAILKGHDSFCEAAINAEMALRCYYEMLIDTKYGGSKKMSDAEFDAVEPEIAVLLKDLAVSAGRYARNIEFATFAMSGMEEEEKTYFAKLLNPFAATPAYAAKPLSKRKQLEEMRKQLEEHAKKLRDLEKNAKSIGDDWKKLQKRRKKILKALVEVGTKEAEEETLRGNIRRACEIGSSVAYAASTVVSSGVGVGLAGASLCTVTSMTSALLGSVSFPMALAGGITNSAEAFLCTVDTIRDTNEFKLSRLSRKEMNKVGLALGIVSFATGGITDVLKTQAKAAAAAAQAGGNPSIAAASAVQSRLDAVNIMFNIIYDPDPKNPKKAKEEIKKERNKLDGTEDKLSIDKRQLERRKKVMTNMEKKFEKATKELHDNIGGGGGGG